MVLHVFLFATVSWFASQTGSLPWEGCMMDVGEDNNLLFLHAVVEKSQLSATRAS